FSTRNVEDCPHLVSAFNTWFRRATHPPPDSGKFNRVRKQKGVERPLSGKLGK
ncbi:hypothetical protein MKX01_038340, partial [Papaver californicum]